MRKSGNILANVLSEVCAAAKPGVSTYELDQFAEELIIKAGGKPAFKGYKGFPGTLCTAIDSVIVHGIPRKDEFLKEGDLFTADCGVIYKGVYTDAAKSIGIGEISNQKKQLLKVAYEALYKAIDMAKPGNRVGQISKVVEETVEQAGFDIVRDLTGHGIGRKLHEEPTILNYFDGNVGPLLLPGMTICIEPIFAAGSGRMKTLPDQWTLVTVDNSTAIQAEHTVLITENGNEILTEL